MGRVHIDKRRLLVVLISFGSVFLLFNLLLLSASDGSRFKEVAFPLLGQLHALDSSYRDQNQESEHLAELAAINDDHPIASLMRAADEAFMQYERGRSKTFRETLEKYRKRYGRHPPPGFHQWYKYARERNVYNIDDFDQIMDDLRPFWGIEPANIRTLAAYMHKTSDGISGMHIRNKKVKKMTNANWRIEAFKNSIRPFVKFLPDLDISMNIHDQPRVVVPWDDMQELLRLEVASRQINPDTLPQFSQGLSNLYDAKASSPETIDPKFFGASREPYMSIAQEACPPLSRARNQTVGFESDWHKDIHGFVTNFNRSSDLCVVGPDIQDKHGLLFASSTMTASRQLLPIFGECKTNINSDILFPANMYTMSDNRYVYDKTYDVDWADKLDKLVWRGVTSGGANTIDNWEQMHRSRLVLLTNATIQADKEVPILCEDPDLKSSYHIFNHFNASDFAAQHSDVSFTEGISCLPDCEFLGNFLSYKKVSKLSKQFVSKYLIDVDGHSFSGRWYAFLKSKSLGIKSTIFREWHDSRLFAWRHFVPLDTSYEELYSILTYFMGVGSASSSLNEGALYVPRHDFAARRLGRQGREWAGKVLRREDIEIYTFRLLLEYARVSDDNRHAIGYGGDGSEMDEFDEKHPFP